MSLEEGKYKTLSPLRNFELNKFLLKTILCVTIPLQHEKMEMLKVLASLQTPKQAQTSCKRKNFNR